MNRILKAVVLSLSALLVVAFLAMVFLCVPMGNKDAVLPMIALYATGIATAGVFLVGGAFSLFYRFWRLTRVGHKYYDNRNSIDKVDK